MTEQNLPEIIAEKKILEKEISDKLNAFISKFDGLVVEVEVSKFYEMRTNGSPQTTIFSTEITITL